MTRKEAKEVSKVVLSYAEGNDLEVLEHNEDYYIDEPNPSFTWADLPNAYRVKEEKTKSKEEVVEFLKNKKIYTEGLTNEIREFLHDLGFVDRFAPATGSRSLFAVFPFIYVEGDMELNYGNDMWEFSKNKKEYQEISGGSVCNLMKCVMPFYTPFRNSEECMRETEKHLPSKIIKNISNGNEHIIKSFYDLNVVLDKELISLEYEEGFKHYVFQDGEPFGMKRYE